MDAVQGFPPARTGGRPPVAPPLLDHVFVVLDDLAYRDVVGSRFLREEFGRVRATTDEAGTGGAGEKTLIALYPASAAPGTGLARLVPSYETPGSIDAARGRLREPGASPVPGR